MPVSIPRSVRQVFGDEAAEDFARWFDESLQERAVPRVEYREVLSRLDMLEHDVSGVKQEIGHLRGEMIAFRQEVNERFDRMNAQFNGRFDQMNDRILTMTRWTIGVLALFGTIMTVLLAIAQFSA